MTIGRIPSVEGGIQPTIFDAAGDLLYASAADTPARLAIGSTDQVLKVSGGIPAWGAPASFTELATGSLTSGTSVSLTSISANHKTLEFWAYGINCASDFGLSFRLNNVTGTSYRSNGTFGSSAVGAANATSISYGLTWDAAGKVNFRISIPNYAAASTYKNINYWALGDHPTNVGDLTLVNGADGEFYNTDAINRIDFISSQTFSSGTYKLYGVN